MAVKVYNKEITSHGREVARTHAISHVARTLRFPLGGFLAFSRAKPEVGDPYYRFLDYLEVVLRVYGRLLSDGRPRSYPAGERLYAGAPIFLYR